MYDEERIFPAIRLVQNNSSSWTRINLYTDIVERSCGNEKSLAIRVNSAITCECFGGK